MSGVKHSNGHKVEDFLPEPTPPLPGSGLDPATLPFDIEKVAEAVRPLRSSVPAECHSAATLGTEREGNAVLISDDGLLLTIGYLIVEATDVVIGGPDGKKIHAQPVGYDHDTGFGLVRALEVPDIEAIPIAKSTDGILPESRAIVCAHGGVSRALDAQVVDRRLFAGSWEYMIDSAIFTAPLHPSWSGAALVDADTGALAGIGSLFVQGPAGDNDEEQQGNMFVPIDLLAPIYESLVTTGRRSDAPRPWLGMHTTEALGHLIVASVFDGGPADKAGILPGDIIEGIEDEAVDTLEDLYRRLWAAGEAGVSIKLDVIRDGTGMDIFVRSGNRREFYRQPQRH